MEFDYSQYLYTPYPPTKLYKLYLYVIRNIGYSSSIIYPINYPMPIEAFYNSYQKDKFGISRFVKYHKLQGAEVVLKEMLYIANTIPEYNSEIIEINKLIKLLKD